MDNSNYNRNKHSEHLGVNKIGKNIRKSPLHQANFVDPAKPVSQPQVYNINKNDFRNIVQQLTGSPSHHSQQPFPVTPLHNSPRSASTRLQRIRPPPLSPMTQPRMPVQILPNQFGQPPPHAATSQSPISAYMRYLQHSINDPGNMQAQSAGLLPNPHVPPLLPSPRTSGLPLPPLLPSPNSQFLLPSPSGYLNLSSPTTLTPNFPFSPGILGPGPRPPPSPGLSFPLSPGFFSVLSPRWRG